MATTVVNSHQLTQLAARAAIAHHSELHARHRLADDMHDLLTSVLWLLEDAGVALPDPNTAETQKAAWL